MAEQHRHHHHHHHRRKKKRTGLIVMAVILGLLIALLLGVFIFLQVKLGKIRRVDPTQETQVPPSEEEFEPNEDPSDADGLDAIDPEDVSWANVQVAYDEKIKNILLIGQDRRPNEGRSRSDSMIVCSINTRTNEITLTSIMRDMYVPIPGYSDNRINSAYKTGGMYLLDKTIEQDLGIHIDGNVEVDFERFVEAMSVVGDLEIYINADEVEYYKGFGYHFHEGYNTLTPEQILTYARTRHVGNMDFERTERQRRVLQAAFLKVRQKSLPEILEFTDEVFPCFVTDLSNGDILNYVYTIVTKNMAITNTHRIPVAGSYEHVTIRGMAVLVPDLEVNSRAIKEYIYGEQQ